MNRLKALVSPFVIAPLLLLVMAVASFVATYDTYDSLPTIGREIEDAQRRLDAAALEGDIAEAIAAQDALDQAREKLKDGRRTLVVSAIVGTMSLISFGMITEPWRHFRRRQLEPVDPSA